VGVITPIISPPPHGPAPEYYPTNNFPPDTGITPDMGEYHDREKTIFSCRVSERDVLIIFIVFENRDEVEPR
jgi:hypothetical protein